jgi:hypothetical protein
MSDARSKTLPSSAEPQVAGSTPGAEPQVAGPPQAPNRKLTTHAAPNRTLTTHAAPNRKLTVQPAAETES